MMKLGVLIALMSFFVLAGRVADQQKKPPVYFYLKTVGPYWSSYGPHREPDPTPAMLERLLADD